MKHQHHIYKRAPEQFELDQTWEWIGEWEPDVESEQDPRFVEALVEIMCCNDYNLASQPHTWERS